MQPHGGASFFYIATAPVEESPQTDAWSRQSAEVQTEHENEDER